MDEMSKEYILQWSGHAASITERFSGLLARQALVDVTLICQEQKLRVHKLVLASCSLYFEEMLEQDLGQEPIILLKDLDFDILKAMVEFMYCGETTITHCHLQSLLDAAQVFKVKDLESIVHGMMSSSNFINNNRESSNNEDNANRNTLNIGKNYIQVRLSGKDDPENLSQAGDTFDDSVTLKSENSVNTTVNNEIKKNNHGEINETIESTNEFTIDELNSNSSINNYTIEYTNEDSRGMIDNCCNEYEQNKSKIVDTSSLSSNKINENRDTSDCADLFDIRNGVGECVRVYTHKKRNEMNGKKKLFNSNNISLPESLTTDCIDLSNDVTSDTAPVTLTTNLDMVTNDYTWGMNTDNIRHVIGSCPTNQENPSFNEQNHTVYDKKNIRQIKELFSIDNNNFTMKRPILRRSERLNQPEIDDNVHNNNETITREKMRFNNNIKSLTKAKRKIKESDENSVETKKNNSRSLRSTSKFPSKSSGSNNNNSTRCSYSKIPKDGKSKSSNSKFKNVNGKLNNKIETIDNDNCSPVKFNTIATVDRALWGDMSDVMENSENGVLLPEYSLSKEIPFAVGLLPLHAALERMQAMPDYQPRKTRSSFAPVKVQQQQQSQPTDSSISGLKKKLVFNDSETNNSSKKSHNSDCIMNNNSNGDGNDDNDENENDNSSTICRIEIHTSPSQCSQSPDSTDHLVSVESTPNDKR